MAGVGPAPQIESEYFKTLEEKIVSQLAPRRSHEPVKVEVFEGRSDVGINRRGKNKKETPDTPQSQRAHR